MKLVALSSIVLLLAVGSTLAQDVRYDFDWEAHFQKFKTYRWIEIEDAQKPKGVQDKKIRDMLDAQLAKKHLRKTNSDTADLYITYQLGVGTERQIASYNTNWGYGPAWHYGGLYGRWYGGWYGFLRTNEQPNPTIYPGQLALDMYDSKNQHLVWRGVVGNAINSTALLAIQEKTLQKVVTKLMKKYPPPPLESLSF